MFSKKILIPILALSFSTTLFPQGNTDSVESVMQALRPIDPQFEALLMRLQEKEEKCKVVASIVTGLAAGAAVSKALPAPLPAKLVAGAATSILVTPWLLFHSLGRTNLTSKPKTWQETIKNGTVNITFLTHPIVAAILGLTVGESVGAKIPTNLPIKILVGSTLATGITAAGSYLWLRLLIALGSAPH